MNLTAAAALAAILTGLGLYGVLARRNAIAVLIGAELLLNAAVLVLVLTDVRLAAAGTPRLLAGQVGALFSITVAAAEIGLALAVVLLYFRTRGTVDLASTRDPATTRDPAPDAEAGPSDASARVSADDAHRAADAVEESTRGAR